MYFSRVRIESGTLAQIKLLKVCQGDIYAVHQLIWKLFPDDPSGKRSFLFRQEFEKEQLSFEDTRRGLPLFYLVSQKAPMPVDGLLVVDFKEYRPKIKADDKFSFELRVNPVIARKTDGKKHSAKHDVLMDAKSRAKKDGITDSIEIDKCMHNAATSWLLNKEKSAGFKLGNADCVEVTAYRQHMLRKNGSKEIKFSSVDLTGTLAVTDPVLFEQTLFNGLGRSKAFGCGLLLIRPIGNGRNG